MGEGGEEGKGKGTEERETNREKNGSEGKHENEKEKENACGTRNPSGVGGVDGGEDVRDKRADTLHKRDNRDANNGGNVTADDAGASPALGPAPVPLPAPAATLGSATPTTKISPP